MQIAVVTFDGFNELDSFVASAIINRAPGVTALQDAWTGTGPQPVQLVVLALITRVAGAVAVRVFRWE